MGIKVRHNGQWVEMGFAGAPGGEPVGTIIAWGGSAANIPSNFRLCDGQALSRTTYSDLFSKLSTIHGSGDGSTTFNIPDLRNKFIVGANNSTGDTTYPGLSPGADGGSANATLPSHTHGSGTLAAANHRHNFPGDDHLAFANGVAGWNTNTNGTFSMDADSSSSGNGKMWYTTYSGGLSVSGSTASEGVSATNANLPPYYALCYIIKIDTSSATGSGVADGDYGDITVSNSGTVWNIDQDTIGPTELIATGVSAGTYTNPSITVDVDGRITAASSGSTPVTTFLGLSDTPSTYVPSAGKVLVVNNTQNGVEFIDKSAITSGFSTDKISEGDSKAEIIDTATESKFTVEIDATEIFEIATGGLKIHRADSSLEGGSISFNRAADDALAFEIDVYGSSNTDSNRFRIVDQTQPGGVERFAIGPNGEIGLGYVSATSARYGTAGQVLTSGGPGAGVTWADASSGIGATDKISEGDSKAEIIDTATESKFTVEIDAAEKFSVDIGGPKIHRQDNSNEGGSIVLNRAADDVAAFEIDVYGSSNTDSGVLRFIDSTGGGERLIIGPAGQIGLSGANYGTSGQVLTSNGSGSAPTWQNASGGSGSGDKISEGNTEAEVVDTGSDGHFKVTTEGTERLRVTSNGSVGIGTNNPSHRLEVAYNDDDDGFVINNTGRGGKYRFATSGPNAENFDVRRYDSANSTFRKYLLFGPDQFAVYTGSTTSSTERLRVTSNGSVGIGTTNPEGSQNSNPLFATKLDVFKSFVGGGDGSFVGRFYGLDTNVQETSVRFITKGTGGNAADLHNASDAYLMHGISNGDTKFVFGANGNVGIGTTNPNAAVDSTNTAKLAVGIVTCNELYVNGTQITGSGGSSDPVGTIVAWAGSVASIPSEYQLCDGSAASTSALQAITGTNVPDLRSRFIAGASNVTGEGTWPSVGVGSTGGNANAVVAAHDHPDNFSISAQSYAYRTGTNPNDDISTSSGNIAYSKPTISGGVQTRGLDADGNVNNTQSGTNANLPPYYALCYIIKHTATSGSGSSGSSGGGITLLPAQTIDSAAQATSVEFTDIPADALEITVIFEGVSLSGTNNFEIQLGTASGYIISNYDSLSQNEGGSDEITSISSFIFKSNAASQIRTGSMLIKKASSTSYVQTGQFAVGPLATVLGGVSTYGSLSSVSGTVNKLRIKSSGSNYFDAGLISVSYKTASSGGSSTFSGLTDTPSSMGTAGQYLAVNSAGTALEYVAAPSGNNQTWLADYQNVQSETGSNVEWTGIPQDTQRIIIMFHDVSPGSGQDWLVQLGNTSGNYFAGVYESASINPDGSAKRYDTEGFIISVASDSATCSGRMVIERSRQDNTRGWVATGQVSYGNGGGMRQFAGSFASSTTISVFDRIRFTSENGTSRCFDGGRISILCEGPGSGGSSSSGGGTVSSGTFTATAGSPSTLESYTYDSAELVFEYTVFVKNGSDYQTQKLLVMRDGTTVDSSQFAVMYSNNLLVQLDATISGGNVNLRATPETGVSGSTTYRIKREVV